MALDKIYGRGREATGGLSNDSPYHGRAIQAGLSTQIIVAAKDANGNKYPIGAIQTLTPTETRPLTRLSEVGTDGVIQITPTAATTIDLAVTRLVFDYQRLPAAFQRGFRHIHAARLPFDVEIHDYNAYHELQNMDTQNSDEAPANWLVTVYGNCWLQTYSYTYDQGNYLISETATLWAEYVYTTDANNAAVKANVGTEESLEVDFSSQPNVSPMSAAYAPTKS